jgi:TolA-binding protein
MTPMDLHPEDLLEREMRGELSEAEQERLELHARQCAVCRLERRARDDFRADSEGPGAEADVARLLTAMAGPLALQGLRRAPTASPMRYVRFVSVAAAVVTMTGLAAASRWSGVRAVVMPWTAEPPALSVSPAKPVAPVAAVRAALAASPAAAAPTPSDPPAADLPAAPEVVSVPAPLVVSVASAPVRRAHPVAAAAPVPATAAADAPTDDADADADAATVFQRANVALRSGDHLRAGELYGLLLNRYPTAPESHASLALFGRMLLDDGNANGALQCFDDYLRHGGALREDVMLGRALAFQHIGPRASADEARAWTSLLEAYPASVHAERARRRLSELARL